MQPGGSRVFSISSSSTRWIVALVVLLFAVALGLGILAVHQATPTPRNVLFGFAAVAAAQAVYWALAFHRAGARLEVTPDAVSLGRPGRAVDTLRWAELEEVRWHWFRPDGFLELRGAGGRSIRVDLGLEAIDDLLAFLADRLRERFPSQLPLIVVNRFRAVILASLFGVAAVLISLGLYSHATAGVSGGFRIAIGVPLAGATGLLFFFGVRKLRVDTQRIAIERLFRSETLSIQAIDDVRIGLSDGRVRVPVVKVRMDGRWRSVLYLGAEPFELFNSIREARAHSDV